MAVSFKIMKGKKAVLFTLIAVLMAALFFVMFSPSLETPIDEKTSVINTRIHVLDTYTRNFEAYTKNSLGISTYKTLENMTQFAAKQNSFYNQNGMPSFNNAFRECMINGTITTGLGFNNVCDNNTRLTGFLDKITQQAKKELNIDSNYTINNVYLQQNYPFDVSVVLDITFTVNDTYASWKRNKIITTSVDISGLSDPFTVINSKGTYRTIIRETSLCKNNDTCWNSSNLNMFLKEQTYRYYKNSSSFLEKFENSTASSYCCGIEILLNGTVGDYNTTYIDVPFWDNTYTCSNGYNILKIDGITDSKFKLDEKTAARFNVVGTKVCPLP